MEASLDKYMAREIRGEWNGEGAVAVVDDARRGRRLGWAGEGQSLDLAQQPDVW